MPRISLIVHMRRAFAPWTLTSALIASSACTSAPDAEVFWEKFIRYDCKFIKKCQKAEWNDENYDNIEDCVDERFDDDLDPGEFSDLCDDYDPDDGQRCLQVMQERKNSCEFLHDDYNDDCNFLQCFN